MSQEINENSIECEPKVYKCKCCECLKKIVIIATGVFIGSTLSILVCAGLLKPKMPPCPPPMFNNPPQIMQPMPQFAKERFRDEFFPHKGFKENHHDLDKVENK